MTSRASDARALTDDATITVFILVGSGAAYLAAGDWPFRAAIFPRLVAGLCFALAAGNLLVLLVRWRGRRFAIMAHCAPLRETQRDQGGSTHVFGDVGSAEWIAVIAWLIAFFGAVWLFGLYLGIGVFTLPYLRYTAQASWAVSLIYPLIMGGALYVAFEVLLQIQVPTSWVFG